MRQQWVARHPGPALLQWEPSLVDASEDGNFAITTGPWEWRPARDSAVKGRGQFLTILIRRQEGAILLERPPSAPTYEVIERDLEKTQLYMWQVAPEVRERIDAERLRMGNIAVAAYLIHLVNHWLGRPMGLSLRATRS